MPLKTAIPKFEIFAPIDDDMGGYPCSLQTRGLYPKREIRQIVAKDNISKLQLFFRKYLKLLRKKT